MGEMQDPAAIDAAREKMSALDVDPFMGDLLLSCSSLDELDEACGKQKLGAGGIQILNFAFSPLFKRDEGIRKRAENKLGPLLEGLPLPPVAEFLAWYFSGDNPGFIFALQYGEQVSNEERRRINDAGVEFMFEIVKEYLEQDL